MKEWMKLSSVALVFATLGALFGAAAVMSWTSSKYQETVDLALETLDLQAEVIQVQRSKIISQKELISAISTEAPCAGRCPGVQHSNPDNPGDPGEVSGTTVPDYETLPVSPTTTIAN